MIMQIEITKSQLQNIVDLATTVEGTLGGGGGGEEDNSSNNDSYDRECRKQLRSIKVMLANNGYKNPFSTI